MVFFSRKVKWKKEKNAYSLIFFNKHVFLLKYRDTIFQVNSKVTWLLYICISVSILFRILFRDRLLLIQDANDSSL